MPSEFQFEPLQVEVSTKSSPKENGGTDAPEVGNTLAGSVTDWHLNLEMPGVTMMGERRLNFRLDGR
jgi:hypothetical protein